MSEPKNAHPVRVPTLASPVETTSVVEHFVKYYYKWEHYEQCAIRAKELVSNKLHGQSVKHKMLHRAKDSKSLLKKLQTRNRTENYQNSDHIFKDVVDLAGVRIILYMPSKTQRDTVGTIIRNIFEPGVEQKIHPDPNEPRGGKRESKYQARNLGYTAVHYRVRMKEEHKNHSYHWCETDYAEIQVVSALADAWSQVEHDILYKSMDGIAGEQEELILDCLNGLVQSGELLLEQLQQLVSARTFGRFGNRHQLGSFLDNLKILQQSSRKNEFTDELDILQRFLQVQEKDRPEVVQEAFEKLGFPSKHKSVLAEIMDQYRPFSPKDSMYTKICLIHYILEGSSADEIAAVHKVPVTPPAAYKCKVMVSALIWVQKLAADVSVVKKMLDDCKREMTEAEKQGIEFVVDGSARVKILEGIEVEEKYQQRMKDTYAKLDAAFGWFHSQAFPREKSTIFGLSFRIAKMGVLKDLPAELDELKRC
jgi:ppGpp synthetase/RelA/SpoT-type nucleotidyltranferase